MKKKFRYFALLSGALVMTSLVRATPIKLNESQQREAMLIVKQVNHATLPFKETVMQHMLMEANYYADRLDLPLMRPIQIKDIVYSHISQPWFCLINETNSPFFPTTAFGTNIYNADIPREQRLRALEFSVRGQIETTNFFFGFLNGKLSDVERLSEHDVEYYSRDLDKLVGKTSLIDTNSAFQLATQWLAAVNMDMEAIGKLKCSVNQLHYKSVGATNYTLLPIFYVDFGTKHDSSNGNVKPIDEPLISVEILGTTEQLQEMRFQDGSFSKRSQMIISNAFDLISTPGQFIGPSKGN
jgi:hypothetical protein